VNGSGSGSGSDSSGSESGQAREALPRSGGSGRRSRSHSRSRPSPVNRAAEQFYTSARWLTSVTSTPSLPTAPRGAAFASDAEYAQNKRDTAPSPAERREIYASSKRKDNNNDDVERKQEESRQEEPATTTKKTTELHFRVHNSSKVISEEEMEQLFRPFSYGSAVHAFQYGGGGLGTRFPSCPE
jgi:hypothetical protein